MNLFNFIARGTAGCPPIKTSREQRMDKITEDTRDRWIHALQADEMRAWLNIGQAQTSTLHGLATMLTIAGLARAFTDQSIETPQVRVIRGAMSVIKGCTDNGAIITETDVVTLQVACREAKDIIRNAPRAAIHYAAINMHAIAHEVAA